MVLPGESLQDSGNFCLFGAARPLTGRLAQIPGQGRCLGLGPNGIQISVDEGVKFGCGLGGRRRQALISGVGQLSARGADI